jgi:hypothetical protein
MSFVTNGGKFKLYTVLNGLLFPTPTQPRISFERARHVAQWEVKNKKLFFYERKSEKQFHSQLCGFVLLIVS